MDLLFWLIRRLFPLGLIVGTGFVMFSSFTPVSTGRVDALGLDASASSGDLSSLLTSIPGDQPLIVRVSLDWTLIEVSQGAYDWSTASGPDLQITSLAAQGRKIIGVLQGGPAYLVTSVNLPIDQTQLLLRWAAFVQAAVDRYGEQIDTWEIGARINTYSGTARFLYPMDEHAAVNPDPALYAKLVKTASAVIKTSDPNDEVWSGTLIGSTSSSCAMNPLTFMLELNGARAWSTLDGITFDPDRSALPEAGAEINPQCAASLSSADTTLSGEVRAAQELIRQLGGKQIRVSGLGWTQDQLTSAASGRSISPSQLQADMTVRASVPLLGLNSVPSVMWNFDPLSSPETLQALRNLDELLAGSKPLGEVQGVDGSIFEYRFQKGSQMIILVWRSVDGDTGAPVSLANLQVKSLAAFPVDATSLESGAGVPVSVDEMGSALILVNERPVILTGTTASLSTGLQQNAQELAESAQIKVKQGMRELVNRQKAALKNWIAGLFDSAKDQAITWGEDKLDELLN